MSIIHPTKLAHVVYRTRRFAQMVHWYEVVFGAQVQYQLPGMAFLTYDDEHHRFAFVDLSLFQPQGGETARQGMIGVDHVAYTYASLPDLLENYARLKEQEILPYWCVHHGMTVSMYYADPDGNQMEFQVDSFASTEENNAFIRGPGFSANPIGVEYDPEVWLAQMRDGAPMSDFLVRHTHEPVSPIRGVLAKLFPAQ